MHLEQVERRFRELQRQHERGELDDAAFRLEVAKLMFRDERGTFWMLDADDGMWYANRGDGWEISDPHAEPGPQMPSAATKGRRRALAWGLALIILLGLVSAVALERLSILPSPLARPTPTTTVRVQVTIASPADGSQVALGHEVAVESMIQAESGLQGVDRVELRVNGQSIETQPVQSVVRPGQTSLPLSQPWLPTTTDQYEVTVAALSVANDLLGSASIKLNVAEAADEVVPEPACTPDAIFVADVTISPGAGFRPGAQMEKVWQVRNSGTCAWGVGYRLARIQGSALEAPDTVSVPPTVAGSTADLAVSFQAPDAAGIFTDTWQLHSPDGTPFGPLLVLSIEVEARAEEGLPPAAPTNLQATASPDGKAVQLSWQDQSDNEDAFRIHRQDLEASIGLAPANAQAFVDNTVTCGNIYRYAIVAFNAAGTSPFSEVAEVRLPPCSPVDAPPTLILTVVPTQIVASRPITIVFQATDDLLVSQVTVQGEGTGDAQLDAGRVFSCSDTTCAATWLVTPTVDLSTTLTILAVARDSSGQFSEPARIEVPVRLSE